MTKHPTNAARTALDSVNFEVLKQAVASAISSDVQLKGKWQNAGSLAALYYGDESTLLNAKAQFIVDAIIPALGKSAVAAMAANLPRKGTPAAVAYNETHGLGMLEVADKAKRDVRATAHTYFNRIVGYAFPKDAVVAEPRDLKTRMNEEITALIKALQKAEDASFDVLTVIKHLTAAQTTVNK
jgi:hypothetical protein